MEIPLKAKYRDGSGAKRNTYKSVTGPHCCCDHARGHCCASGRKKGRKATLKAVPSK